MQKQANLRLSDKEANFLEDLKKAYNISNTSELIRVLIRKDHDNLMMYEGVSKLSDKQIISYKMHPHCNTKNYREVN